MSPRKERIKKQGLLMIQQRELHSAEKQLFSSVVSFSTTASSYSQSLTNAHPNYLIMPASISQEPIPLFHILDKGRDCLNHLYCCLITPLPPFVTSLVHFNDLLQLVVYISLTLPAISRLQNLQLPLFNHNAACTHINSWWGPAQCSALNLHYFTCSSQQTYKLHVALFSWVHIGGNGLGG